MSVLEKTHSLQSFELQFEENGWFPQQSCRCGSCRGPTLFPSTCLEVLDRANGRKWSSCYLPFGRKNAALMWMEGKWVVLLGWLGNTAFI